MGPRIVTLFGQNEISWGVGNAFWTKEEVSWGVSNAFWTKGYQLGPCIGSAFWTKGDQLGR